MPDIIITPSSGLIDFFPVSTRVGRIEGSGNTINIINPSGYVAVSGSGLSVNTSSPNATFHAYSAVSGATLLNLEGTNGSLFSVVDNLSGTLMSVNNNAGLPVFEVFSDDRVVAGRFGQNDFVMTSGGNIGIGTGVPSSKFHVVGTSTFGGDISSTGSFIAGSGSAGNPSFEFVGDTDTGMFSPAANTIGLSTSGVERIRINNIGNVGIGTTTPSGQLHVIGSGIFSSGVYANNIGITGNMVFATNTNGNLIIKPNGSGSLQADDSGNSRGLYSVDLQRSRSSVSGVSAGNYSVIVGGHNNRASGDSSTVGGGVNNVAGSHRSTVGGGTYNTASGYYSVVSGGRNNTASNYDATVGGGNSNTASGYRSTVGGGAYNASSSNISTVGGGAYNTSSAYGATIGGGASNTASGMYSTVGGGFVNNSSALGSTVSGGKSNTSSGDYATIGGGYGNVINSEADYSVIAGGSSNTISMHSSNSVIGGGASNNCYGTYQTISGGNSNSIGASSSYSFIGAGYNNTINGSCTHSVVCGGSNNTAEGQFASVVGGYSNSAGTRATVGGGEDNSATGNSSTIAGGGKFHGGNTASGHYSMICGGHSALADRYGQRSHANGSFATNGDAQLIELVLRGSVTHGHGTSVLNLDGTLHGANNNINIPSNKILSGTINILGSSSDGLSVARYIRQFTIKNVNGTTSLVGSIITIGTDVAAGSTIDITADDNNDMLHISVANGTNDTWRWVAHVEAVELAYA